MRRCEISLLSETAGDIIARAGFGSEVTHALEIVGGALMGAKVIEKLLGPTADYLGAGLSSWTEKRRPGCSHEEVVKWLQAAALNTISASLLKRASAVFLGGA